MGKRDDRGNVSGDAYVAVEKYGRSRHLNQLKEPIRRPDRTELLLDSVQASPLRLRSYPFPCRPHGTATSGIGGPVRSGRK